MPSAFNLATTMNGKDYLEHLAGIASLMEWMLANEKAGYRFRPQGDELCLDEQITRRFIIGVPRSKRWGKSPFLGAQRREAVFLKLLKIGRAVVREGDSKLYLVVPTMRGDGMNYPDLPAFVVSLAFDDAEKAAILSQTREIECRGFWIDDNGQVEISSKSMIWTLPLNSLPKDAPLLTDEDQSDGLSFKDLIRLKLDSTNVAVDPGFVRAR